jgi:hypothetical protein
MRNHTPLAEEVLPLVELLVEETIFKVVKLLFYNV